MISLASMADFYSSCFLAAVIFVWTVGDLAATSYFVGSFATFCCGKSWNCADAIQDGLARCADLAEAMPHSSFRGYGFWASQSIHNRWRLLMIQTSEDIKTIVLMTRNWLLPWDDAYSRYCENCMVPFHLERMAYYAKPGIMNFHDTTQRVLENAFLFAARYVRHGRGAYSPYQRTLKTMRTGIYHAMYTPQWKQNKRLSRSVSYLAERFNSPQRPWSHPNSFGDISVSVSVRETTACGCDFTVCKCESAFTVILWSF